MRKKTFFQFTLVELLVVIAIIAILAGLLLPGLNKTLGKARSIACTNQLRQQYMAVVQYADDLQDELPQITKTEPRVINGENGLGRLVNCGYLPGRLSGIYQKPKLFRCTVSLGEYGWFDKKNEGSDYHLTRDCSDKIANAETTQFTCFDKKFSHLKREILIRCLSTGTQLNDGLHEGQGLFIRANGEAQAMRKTIYEKNGGNAKLRLNFLDKLEL